MEKPAITLPSNRSTLLEKAKAAIEAKKAALRGSREETQQELVNAQLGAEKATQKLRNIAEQEASARKEAEELERQRQIEKLERQRQAGELERQRQAGLEELELREAEARREWARTIRSKKRGISNADAERMQRVSELAKKRGDKIEFVSEEDAAAAEEENMDAVSPFSLMALSPKGACDMYKKVRLNTIRGCMAGINRLLAKAVATNEIIKVREKKIRPDDAIDTLCVFTDEMREDMMELYRQKGWKVRLEGNNPKKFTYVFQPQPATAEPKLSVAEPPAVPSPSLAAVDFGTNLE